MPERATESAAVSAALTFPFASSPAPGEALEVGPGVRWLRMRLPMAGLNHINLWALEDQGGWTLVDTGMQTADTAADWHSAFAGPLSRGPACHLHPHASRSHRHGRLVDAATRPPAEAPLNRDRVGAR